MLQSAHDANLKIRKCRKNWVDQKVGPSNGGIQNSELPKNR